MNLLFDENDAKIKRDFESVVSTDIGISFLGISPSFEGVAVPISPPTVTIQPRGSRLYCILIFVQPTSGDSDVSLISMLLELVSITNKASPFEPVVKRYS